MTDQSFAFIGGGNMTRAIVGGLLESSASVDRIVVAEPGAEQRTVLAAEFAPVDVCSDNVEAVADAAVCVLAVKPQVLPAVCQELAAAAQARRPLVLSIAAGVRSDAIDGWLGGGLSVVRVMPNQPALLRRGVSGLFANAASSDADIALATRIMSAIGEVVVVDSESEIDIVTAVSGSGPAYFYLLIDMLAQAAEQQGLPAAAARRLALATATGSAELAAASDESLSTLIERVRSPGGTTAAALDSLEAAGIRSVFAAAVNAARERAAELADEAEVRTGG